MQAQTIIVMLIVLAAAAYVARLFWKAIRGTRADAAGGCATGGCGCRTSEVTPAPANRSGARQPVTRRR